MLKNLLILSSFMVLTACQSVPVKNIEIKKAEVPIPKVIIDSDNDGVPDDIDKCPNTPINKPVDRAGCPLDYEGSELLRLQIHLFFDKNSTAINPLSEPEVKYLATRYHENAKGNSPPHIIIDSYNSTLEKDVMSKNRALLVKQILIEQYGINEKDISEVNIHGKTKKFMPSEADKKQFPNIGYILNQQISIFVGY